MKKNLKKGGVNNRPTTPPPLKGQGSNDSIEIKKYLDKIKPIIESATSKQLFETSNELAENLNLRKETEKAVNATLPEGYTFKINESGFGQLTCPLYVSQSNAINEQKDNLNE